MLDVGTSALQWTGVRKTGAVCAKSFMDWNCMHSTALHWVSCMVPCFAMPSDTICPMCANERESLFHAAQTRERVHTGDEEMYVALCTGTTKLHQSKFTP